MDSACLPGVRLVWCVVLLAGCLNAQPAVEPTPEPAPPNADVMQLLETLAAFPELRFETDRGEIRMLLYTEWLPETTTHIGDLADSGFYDGTIIHRVVDDFVIQGGDPTGTGEGGSGPGGLSTNMVPLEIKEGLQFLSGSVGLARWTEDTGDSQWFITEKPALHLSNPQGQPNELLGPYALFAQVFDGMEVVRDIARVPTLPNDRPIVDVDLQTASLLPPPGADLFNFIMEPVGNYETWFHVGVLEVPRYVVAGHPALLRFTTEDAPCDKPGPLWISNATHEVFHHGWVVTSDPCTFEARIIFPEATAYTIAATDVVRADTVREVVVDVLPWHDAYAPYTGTVMNGA